MAIDWKISQVKKRDDGSYMVTATRTEADDTTNEIIYQDRFSGTYYPDEGTELLKQRLIQAVQRLKAKRAEQDSVKAALQTDLDAAVSEIEA